MPQVLFRAIKAKPINWQAFRDEIARTMDAEVKPALLSYFERVTKSWRNQQTFKATKKITREQMTVNVVPVGPNAEIWKYVSQGARPHIIRPKGRGYPLRFEWGGYGSYKPRTTPSGGYRGPGRVVGGKTVRFMQVKHPGNKARNFEKHIARWYAPQFRRTMKNAVARATRRANRAS
jgi:hypothetical protein